MIEGVSKWFGWDCGCEVSSVGGIVGRVSIVGKVLQLFSSCGSGSERKFVSQGRSFSLLRFVGMAGILIGVCGQKTDPFPAVIDLANLNTSDGFVIDGVLAGHKLGSTVSGISDINSDGMDDIAIASHRDKKRTYVLFGHIEIGKHVPFNLSLFNDSMGFIVSNGVRSISGGSDINDDGITDLVIGHSNTLIIFGHSNISVGRTLSLSSLNGTNGFVFSEEGGGDRLGSSVSLGGDVNGDGIADILIGANLADHNGIRNVGKAYLIFGNASIGRSGTIEAAKLNKPVGNKIFGEAENDYLGSRVLFPGDVNNDGVDDILISAIQADTVKGVNSGENYLFFGNSNLVNSGVLDVSSLSGKNGFRISGQGNNVYVSGKSKIGDINVDGVDDLIFAGKYRGASTVYIVYGDQQIGVSGFVDLNLNGSNGFKFFTDKGGDDFSDSVAGDGDVNGDGVLDLIFADPEADPLNRTDAGRIYVVYGGIGLGRTGRVDIANINSTHGFVIIGGNVGDQAGTSISYAGDVNNDGVDDLLIGAPFASPNNITEAGRVYVIFGRKVGHPIQDTKFNMGTTQVYSTSNEMSSQVTKGTNMDSMTATNTRMLPPADAPNSTGLAIGVGLGLAAFLCSLVAGGLFYMRRKRVSHTSSKSHDQEDPLADYVSIDSALSGMQSARAENAPNSNYDIIPSMSQKGDYNDWPAEPSKHTVEHYNKVGLDTLNRDMDEYNAVKFKDAQEEYDDIPDLKPMIAT